MCVSRMFVGQRLQMDQSIKFIYLHPGGWSLSSRVPCDSICDVAHPPFLNRNVMVSKANLLDLISKKWSTPNTYNRNFEVPPQVPGVYVILGVRNYPDGLDPITFSPECVYVGSSKNLYKRYLGHPVRSNKDFWWTGFYFKPEANYLEIEKRLIKGLRPLLNIKDNG